MHDYRTFNGESNGMFPAYATHRPAAMEQLFEIIDEDGDLLVINKPAGLVCHPTKAGPYSSLVGRLRLHLGVESPAHLINRLDRETSGLVLVAKHSSAAGELGRIWENRQVEKEYAAIVHGHVTADQFVIDAPLGRDVRSAVAIKDCVRQDGQAACTEGWVRHRFSRNGMPFSLLRLIPRTGRKHQLRIHLAHLGHPIVGDKIYGGDEDLYLALVENRLTEEQRTRLILDHHALHAGKLTFIWRGHEKLYVAPPELSFRNFVDDPASPARAAVDRVG